MPAPGDRGTNGLAACGSGLPRCVGCGDTDWTLLALQIAAASLAGPGTSAAGRDRAVADRATRLALEHLTEILRVGVARGERREAERRLDQLERRRVFERPVVDDPCGSQIGHDDGRHPEAQLAVVRDQLTIGRRRAITGVVDRRRIGVVDDARRRNVVVEATPLVVGHDEHSVVEIPVVGEGVVSIGDEPLAETDVGQRVIVGRGSVAFGVERRIDEAHVGQQALGARVDERQRVEGNADRVGVAGLEGVPEG